MSIETTQDQPLFSNELSAEIGQFLKKARERKGLSIDQVAHSLKIRGYFLECIELGNLQPLPSRIYAQGFLKSYARYLDVDVSAKIERLFNDGHVVTQKAALHPFASAYQMHPQTWWTHAVAIVLGLLLLAGVYWLTPIFSRHEVSFSLLEKRKNESPSFESSASSQLQPEESGVFVPGTLQIGVSRTTWIKITDGQKQLVTTRLIAPHETYVITLKSGYQMTCPDSGALQLFYNGQRVYLADAKDKEWLESAAIDDAALAKLATTK